MCSSNHLDGMLALFSSNNPLAFPMTQTTSQKKNPKSEAGLTMKGEKMKGRKFLVLFRVALIIAAIIFFTAVLSDFSVKMFYDSTDRVIQFVSGVVAIVVIAIFIMFLFYWIPETKNALLKMFGLDEEGPKKEKSS